MESKSTQDLNGTVLKKCVIEFQGFRNNRSDFIIKELSIVDVSTGVVNYFVFKPPFAFRCLNRKASKTNDWLSLNFHHISWNEGFTSYKELHNIMQHYCQQYDVIYTTGLEKSQFIKRYASERVRNITVNPNFQTNFVGLCIGLENPVHKTANCALSRAFRVGEFLRSMEGEQL